MSITDGTILRVVASFLWTDGNVAQNVYNAVITGGGSPWDDEDVVDDASEWMNAIYINLSTAMSDEIDGNSIILYKYDAVHDDWDEVGSNSWAFNPSNDVDQLPRGVAGLIRLWTTDPDVQGKKYIPGLTETASADGLFSAGTLTALLGAAFDWYDPFTAATSGALWTPGIWSVAGVVFKAAVEHYAVSAIPAYQRRRKRNVGI